MKEKHLMIYMNYKGNVMKSGRARRLLLLLLLRRSGRELRNIGCYQEVHHRLIALLHGEQLRDFHVSASAHSPSHSCPHLFPERLLLVSPSAAVVEEMLLRLGYCAAWAAAPTAFVVISVSETFQARSNGHMSGSHSVEPGCQ